MQKNHAKAFTAALLLLCLTLAGCMASTPTTPETTAPAPQPTSSQASTLPATQGEGAAFPANGMPVYTGGFVNLDLLSLLRAENTSLKEYYDGRCYAYATPMGAGALEYYQPYVNILFEPPLEGSLLPSGQDDRMVWGVHETNPFTDSLVITAIHFQGYFDTETQQVTDQSSLRQFFVTEEVITYALLNERLSQVPDLVYYNPEHHADAGIFPVFECDYDPHRRAIPVDSGTYFADYDIHGESVRVKFVLQDDGHIAESVYIA